MMGAMISPARLAALAALLLPAAAAAQPAPVFEGAEASIQSSIRAAAALRDAQKTTLQPALQPRAAGPLKGAVLARVNLASELDRNLHVTSETFGARKLDLGLATDAGFKSFYFTFSDADSTTLAAIGQPKQLIGDGVDARIDAKTVYNFRVSIDIFNPTRGSTLEMTPTNGTAGPSSSLNTGSLLDAVRARAAVFTAGGVEYWLFYGRDALPDGSGLARTRSLLFVHEDGTSTQAWPLAASALAPGATSSVNLGATTVALTLGADGTLVVSQ
jgi:hypothetical protein